MTNVKSKKIIKANIIGGGTPINANIIKNDNTIKSTLTTYTSATTTNKGIIRIATDEETINGIDNSIAITPYTLRKATTYVHEQGIASDIWVINHNLNKHPSIGIVDSSGSMQIPDDVIVNNENTITVLFIAAFAGKAYLN